MKSYDTQLLQKPPKEDNYDSLWEKGPTAFKRSFETQWIVLSMQILFDTSTSGI